MTKQERQLFKKIWFEAEDIIATIDPHQNPRELVKASDQAGMEELDKFMEFLRVMVKYILLDKEATQRERESVTNMLLKKTQGADGSELKEDQ